MKVYQLAILASLAAAPAFAQQATAPAFVPWMVTQEESDGMAKFLADKPYSVSAPIICWLASKEQQAQQADAAEKAKNAPKPDVAPTPFGHVGPDAEKAK